MTKYLFLLFVGLPFALLGQTSVESEAGNLKNLIENPTEVNSLQLSGTINAADLEFIATKMTGLMALDLSKTSIVAYSGERIQGLTNHAANTIPPMIFAGSNIESLSLPSSGEISIGDAAFAGAKIKTLTLAANISAMGTGCFDGCLNLSDVNIACPELGAGSFAACSTLNTVTISNATRIGDYCFSGCSQLATVNGANQISSIGKRAFAQCKSLSKLGFGNSLTEIGDEAFVGSALTEVDLTPCSALASVGDWAFAKIESLESLNLGSAKTVGHGVVFECSKLESFAFSTQATEVGDFTYTNNVAMSYDNLFHNGVVKIGRYALSGLTQIEKLYLPSSLQYIGAHGMERMTGLKELRVATMGAPELGDDVWAEVNKDNVILVVYPAYEEDFKSADQWKDFTYTKTSDSNDAIAVAKASVKGMFEGKTLYVKVIGCEAQRITLYGIDGQLLVDANFKGEIAEIDTSHFAANMYVVTVLLADGRITTLKIAR